MEKTLNEIANQIHAINKEKGFWDKERNVGEMLMLVVTELAEALEAHRKGEMVDKDLIKRLSVVYPQVEEYNNSYFAAYIKDKFEDEIADTFIRLFDLCGGLGIDIDTHIRMKVEYNKSRERLHGKKY